MPFFDKNEIRDNLTVNNIFDLLQEWGGDPEFTSFGVLSHTICHNLPGEGSQKLYYYTNSNLFRCYTGCDSYFDVFELMIKIMDIQKHIKFSLGDSIKWVAQRFGFTPKEENALEGNSLEDWKYLTNYERIQEIGLDKNDIILKEYNKDILSRFNYNIKIKPWLEEDISSEALRQALIGYYPGGAQITIPHFDINNRLIGIRGRTLSEEEGNLYGKYRPLKINKEYYNHPLGMNLYNLNNSKETIKIMKKAIIFEGELFALVCFSQQLLGVCGFFSPQANGEA